MYLTDKYRPTKLDEIIGQEHITKIISKIIKSPEKYPKNFIFQGSLGCGKTSTARVFGDLITDKNYIKEYDVSVIGNVDSMTDIKFGIDNVLMFKKEPGVLIFNEIQEASKRAQSLLLETLEDNLESNIYFIFTTTDVSKVLDTIRSRCAYEFNFRLISPDKMFPHLKSICEKEQIEINDECLNLIITKSKGHMRNAINLIDVYKLDSDNFKDMINDTVDLLRDYIFKGKDNLNPILTYPSTNLKEDLNILISEYIQKEEDLPFKIMFFENYMKYKNYIDCIEDIISVLNILRKLYEKKR